MAGCPKVKNNYTKKKYRQDLDNTFWLGSLSMETQLRHDLPRKMAKNMEIGRMRRDGQNLRKVKITNNNNTSDMDIYEICVHFQTPTKDGGRETWNLRQTEYYDNNEDALEACRRLRRLLCSLGKLLFWVSDPTGSIVWTSDPEAYKNLFRYELLTRSPEVLPLD